MYILEPTFDDLLRSVLEKLALDGKTVKATRGTSKELTGVLLCLSNPRARLSRTETKGRIFSCMGELLWYLSKTNALDLITYYLPRYQKDSEDGQTIYGGYGPRFFNMHDKYNQIDNVITLLRQKQSTRRAVIQIFDAGDISDPKRKEIPCTCSLQFICRDKRLDLLVSMRSNDVLFGLPHDIFAFTMLQEIIARSLDVEVGIYKHFVGSLHLYDDQKENAAAYLSEGFQSTNDVSMPPMPKGDPWPSIKLLLDAEAAIRLGEIVEFSDQQSDPYWLDLIHLLQIFRCVKDGNDPDIDKLKKNMNYSIYAAYINDKQLRRTQDEQLNK